MLYLEQTQKTIVNGEQKARIFSEIKKQYDQLDKLKANFNLVATEFDTTIFYQKAKEKVDWQEELVDIFSPYYC